MQSLAAPAERNTLRLLLLMVASSACFCALPRCFGQVEGAVCNGGAGQFSRKFTTGVIVTVGPEKDRGFAQRACEASLVRNSGELVVASGAAQVDIDVLGADLGLGMPVVAFQIEKSDMDIGTTYEVYSLRGPPHRLRMLRGGDWYRAADTDLDGRIEIWTRDAVAVHHFEGIPLGDFETPPTLVLRFENQHLVDVSSQFQDFYNLQIAQLRSELSPGLIGEFKNCDGQLSVIPPAELKDLHDLTTTKIKVLEIIWAYLYSGREQEAWRTLAELWPASDVDRIRNAIVDTRAGGIRSQLDLVPPAPLPRNKKRVQVYELALQYTTANPSTGVPEGSPRDGSDVHSSPRRDVTMPDPIFMDTPPPPDAEHSFPRAGIPVEMVVDSAGKVNAIRILSKDDGGPVGQTLIKASSHWKFIPALRNGQAVASHIRMTISLYR